MKTIPLNYNRTQNSPIIISNTFNDLYTFWKQANKGQSILCVTTHELESLINEHLTPLFQESETNFHIYTIPSGEPQKNLTTVSEILDILCNLKFERIDTIIAFGGGVIGDLVGFVAASYLRGINLIQCPTSLLAQVDASIGGKTGVNHTSGKNLIGSFYQPLCTFINPKILHTLPTDEMRCGMAEIVKYGIIRDPELFEYLETHANDLSTYQYTDAPDKWDHIITRSAHNKAEVVQLDEKEAGLRETLNLGHTFGHAIEAAHRYIDYKHGEAVALGMAIAANAATHKSLLSNEDNERIQNLLKNLKFDCELDHLQINDYIPLLQSDKKVRKGKIRFILPVSIGDTCVYDKFTTPDLIQAYKSLTDKG